VDIRNQSTSQKVTEFEVMTLHGMGPNAMQVLRDALREHGLSFRAD
jgi:hypothetical protein